ncbi:MAG: hypothetical protein DHS20C15_33830 [Planctomycetota bacterium]|nr:MAG: hypothetical protein DHS20C15_33830 [Planctomycetota bacterium]
MLIRLLLVAALAAASVLPSCQLIQDSVRGTSPMNALSESALAIVGVEPRLSSSATSLAADLVLALEPQGALPSTMGATLDDGLRRFNDSIDELRWRRNKLKKLGSKVVDNWSEQTAFLPPGHPWRDLGSASANLAELQQTLMELDALLVETETSMSTAAAALVAPIAILAEDISDEQVNAQRASLEAGLSILTDLPEQLAADAKRLREFAESLTSE